jgi:arginine deiminase
VNTNYRHRIQWDSLNNINCYRDNTLVLSATNDVYAAGNKFLHFTQGEYSDGRGGDRYMDWVFVRKYSVNEPFVSGWG